MTKGTTTGDSPRHKLAIVTTVPETLFTILRQQPAHLARHFDVMLVTSPGATFEAISAREQVPLFGVSMQRGIAPLRDIKSIAQMVRLLRRERPDIVQSYTPKAGLVAMSAAFIARVPHRIHTFTGLIFPTASGPKRHILKYMDRIIAALATKVVAESAGVAGDLERAGIGHGKIERVGWGNIAGVDTQFLTRDAKGVPEAVRDIRGRLNLGDDAFTFLFVGRLTRDKGLPELLQAFCALDGEKRLLLVGHEDARAPLPAAAMRQLRDTQGVDLIGFQDDVRPYLAAADCLVLPSHREGFPNVLLEAAAMGLPMIATRVSGAPEVVRDGETGWLVPIGNAQALRAAMSAAMALPKTAIDRYGAAGRALVRERYERSDHWSRLIAFYRGQFAGRNEAG